MLSLSRSKSVESCFIKSATNIREEFKTEKANFLKSSLFKWDSINEWMTYEHLCVCEWKGRKFQAVYSQNFVSTIFA